MLYNYMESAHSWLDPYYHERKTQGKISTHSWSHKNDDISVPYCCVFKQKHMPILFHKKKNRNGRWSMQQMVYAKCS